MDIKRCCVCDMLIYPGEKCYQVRIWVYPEGEEELFDWGVSDSEEVDILSEEGTACDSRQQDTYCGPTSFCEDEIAHEIHLTLCKSCKVRLLANPSAEAGRLFVSLDTMTKIVH
jgi:hypothetical protein